MCNDNAVSRCAWTEHHDRQYQLEQTLWVNWKVREAARMMEKRTGVSDASRVANDVSHSLDADIPESQLYRLFGNRGVRMPSISRDS